MQPAVVFPHLLHNFHHLFSFFVQLQSGKFHTVRATFADTNYRFGIQRAQIAVKLGFKGVQGRLANLLLFIDHYFNAHKKSPQLMTSIERLYSWVLIFAMSSSVSSETHCKASPFSSSLHSLVATSLRKKSMRWSFKDSKK
nr:MAG TPA: hypothetical protein [Caudoviricetes sp.]